MELTDQSERKEILKNAIDESELSDLKQHADKMIRGFENFNKHSSDRAIWELVQNACDLTEECEIEIDYRANTFSFSHNGKPFTTNSLISLIKQVSGKYGEETKLPEVGKYGTGFLTTHAFGRQFKLNSFLKAGDTFFEIKEFLIDRSPKEWKPMTENIKAQKEEVFKLIEKGEIVSNFDKSTTFTYLPDTQQEYSAIEESGRYLDQYIPLVLAINERLKKVIIKRKDCQSSFFLEEKLLLEEYVDYSLYSSKIIIDGQIKEILSLKNEGEDLEIILPMTPEEDHFRSIKVEENLARLFLYYPLIGSEDFGINFIINCKKFLPTEPRDGIHLQSNKDQVNEQEESNRQIIEIATNILLDFLQNNSTRIKEPLLISRINFKTDSEDNLLNSYFEKLQKKWTDSFLGLPFVKIEREQNIFDNFQKIEETIFFKEELVEHEEIFDEVYELASRFYDNIPIKDEIRDWSRYVAEWNRQEIKFIGHQDLAKEISKKELSDFNKSSLKNYYSFLLSQGIVNVFKDNSILPNIQGQFINWNVLKLAKDITPNLIKYGKVLIPEAISKLVHEDFQFDFEFPDFNRKDFANEVKNTLDDEKLTEKYYSKDLEDETISIDMVETDFFKALLDYCKLSPNVKSNSKPSQLLRIISLFYKYDEDLIELSKLADEENNLDSRSARKILVNVFFNTIEKKSGDWVKDNIQLLKDVASCYEDSLKDVFDKSDIYPNQIFKLKNITELKRDLNISEEIKNYHQNATGIDIRETLIYNGFNQFVNEKNFISEEYLATEIENEYFQEGEIFQVGNHKHKEDILKIISNLTETRYSRLFRRLNDKKATLMLELINNERTKEDIFSIVTLDEEQINRLGQLVKNANFKEIIEQASKTLEQEKTKRSDFAHKYKIGTFIEQRIREKLGDEVSKALEVENPDSLETSDVQGGQDIIIYLNQRPVYFIEVKSRWNSENSVSMSKLQLERAVEQNACYALCSVDITRYKGDSDKYELPIEEILPVTRFVENIGNHIAPLIQPNLYAEKHLDENIHLIDYRGIIPQPLIKSGKDFDDFINSILEILNQEISYAYPD